MKTFKLITTTFLFACLFLTSSLFAQTDYVGNQTQTVRNTSLVPYTVANGDGVNATFIWTVSGGTIVVGGVDYPLTYTQTGTAAATVSINVRWDAASTTTVNSGTLSVSKSIGALACTSADLLISVNSWVAPSANVTSISPVVVCSGTAATVDLAFQGNVTSVAYRWRVVRVSDNAVIEDHTTTDATATSATTTVSISAIANATTAPVDYRFELTRMQDAFTTPVVTTFTTGSVIIRVNPIPVINNINSSSSLILR